MDAAFLTRVFYGVSSIIVGIYFVYEVKLHRKNREIESKRHYYPLDFQKCSKFHIYKSDSDVFHIKQIKKHDVENDGFVNITRPTTTELQGYVDDGGYDGYKLQKKIQKSPDWWKQEWYLLRNNEVKPGNYVACIHFARSMWKLLRSNYIYFPARNRFDNMIGSSIPTGSIIGNEMVAVNEFALEPLPIRHDALNGNTMSSPFTNINTSETSYTQNDESSPYLDPSLKMNQTVKRSELGESEFIANDVDLMKFEKRQLFKVSARLDWSLGTTTFKVCKNSMDYRWNINGYLEKNSSNTICVSTERIGFVHIENKNNLILYLNEDRIDKESAISTFFYIIFSISVTLIHACTLVFFG